MNNRKGVFTISKDLIDNHPENVMKIMSNVIIIHCEYSADYGKYQYNAISPLFEELKMGRFPPEYGFTTGPDGVKAFKVD